LPIPGLDEGDRLRRVIDLYPVARGLLGGINKPFEDPDLKKYLGVFEGESREIYALRKEIVAACKVKPGMAVTDIGAGTGLFTRLLAREVGDTGRVYAVDIAERFIKHIEKTCQEQA
jgi:cyclopropane fatty-acyl-phospholipid synthase-like methyltransferase